MTIKKHIVTEKITDTAHAPNDILIDDAKIYAEAVEIVGNSNHIIINTDAVNVASAAEKVSAVAAPIDHVLLLTDLMVANMGLTGVTTLAVKALIPAAVTSDAASGGALTGFLLGGVLGPTAPL
jgi:hypothetical protein